MKIGGNIIVEIVHLDRVQLKAFGSAHQRLSGMKRVVEKTLLMLLENGL